MYFVYILQSEKTFEFYKGQAADIHERVKRHNMGIETATKHGVPWILIWFVKKTTRSEAVILEKKLKNLSRERTIRFIEKYHENGITRVLTFPDISAKPKSGKSGC